jgi:hypothetical protein
MYRTLFKVFAVFLVILIALSSTLASWLVVLIFAIHDIDMWVRYSRAECISVSRLPPFAVIKIADCGETLEDIVDHAKERISKLRSIAEKRPSMVLEANIHFRRYLDPDEALRIVEDYNLTVTWYSTVYFNPKGEYIAASSGIVRSYEELKSVISGARVEGFVVKANATTLVKLQDHPLVFLVDPGPIDMIMGMKALGYRYIDMRWTHPPGYMLSFAYWKLNRTELPKVR